MFQPTEHNLIHEQFALLVKCLNIHVGDVRNVGYMHKNPQWEGVYTFQHYNLNNVVSFDTLYSAVFNHFNKSETEVEQLHSQMVKEAYTQNLINELAKDKPNKYLVQSYSYRAILNFDLRKQIDELMNNGEPAELSPRQYAKYLIIHNHFFGRKTKSP